MLSQPHLLLVDDDAELTEMMREYLEPEGFTIDVVSSGVAFQNASFQSIDLIILDVMLPGKSGFEILREFRKTSSIPVIMLTAKDSDVDRVVGLEIGADDYVSKPFNPRELVARVRAVLRRTSAESKPVASTHVHVGDVMLDSSTRTARCRGQVLDLTTAEFNLLEFFLRKTGQPVNRDELSQAAFGKRHGTMIDRNVDTLVSKLRRKLDPESGYEHRIKTVRNLGYIYTQPLE